MYVRSWAGVTLLSLPWKSLSEICRPTAAPRRPPEPGGKKSFHDDRVGASGARSPRAEQRLEGRAEPCTQKAASSPLVDERAQKTVFRSFNAAQLFVVPVALVSNAGNT